MFFSSERESKKVLREVQLRFFPVELLPRVEMFSSLQTMLTKAFFPKVGEKQFNWDANRFKSTFPSFETLE